MTVFTVPGWLQNAGAVNTAEQLRNYAGSLGFAGAGGSTSMQARGGVHPALGNEMQVTQTGVASMAVIVKSGMCAIPGTEGAQQGTYGLGNDGDVTLSISAAHATLARVDIVIARIRDQAYSGAVNTGVLEVVTGTPAGSPVAPATPANSLVFANVTVPAAASSIVTGNISDQRRYLAGVGGVIRGRTTETYTNMLSPGQPVYFADTGRVAVATDAGTTFRSLITDFDEQVFVASGTWNKPVGAQFVMVEIVGAGGGGGGIAGNASGIGQGGGGGGGGFARKMYQASALGASEAVTIGAGGAGGVGSGTGSTGGNTVFSGLTANGGLGGTGSTATTGSIAPSGGAGSTATGGDINIRGEEGDLGRVLAGSVIYSGRGGQAAGGYSTRGGVSTNTGANGNPGTGYGSGGSGALAQTTTRNGGAGAGGLVVVRTFK